MGRYFYYILRSGFRPFLSVEPFTSAQLAAKIRANNITEILLFPLCSYSY